MIKCIMCKQDKTDNEVGIAIRNYCIDIFPENIEVCKLCAENLAVGLLSGKFP